MNPIDAPKRVADADAAVALTLDERAVQAQAGETLLHLVQRLGGDLPHWCAGDGLATVGSCRACLVEVAGERALSAACARVAQPGMVVRTASDRARAARAGVQALLEAEANMQFAPVSGAVRADSTGAIGQNLSQTWVALGADASHPALRFDASRCIVCTRCVRACRDVQGHAVIGLSGRGAHTRIVFDQGVALAASRCVACGECVSVCPTGALAAQPGVGLAPGQSVDKAVPSVCPYCGVGCQISYQVRDGRLVGVAGRDGPANHARLCVKGRFGWDYVQHPQRLTQPLIRRADAPKRVTDVLRSPDDWAAVFRPATWDEALDAAVAGWQRTRSARGPHALGGLGSAKGSNEEAYLFQKLIRAGLGTHNVDHCTRLCHASSVAGLLEALGSGSVSNPVADVAHAELVLVIGSNTAENHPVAATWLANAVARGTRLVVADPRITPLARHAWRTLNFMPDADLALVLALLHVVFDEGLEARDFIAARVDGADAWRAAVREATPEAMAPLCGIPPELLREVARAYAQSPAAMILWGMGVSQHVHGTDNVRALIALALVCGQIGRPGTGLHPLRGQNNVQGASDAGLIPMMLPNYQRVADAAARARLEALWGVSLPTQPGLTTVELLNHARLPGADPARLCGLYIMGENPAMSDPDLTHARAALASLDHLVVQDIFLTETAWLADVVLPASAWPEKVGTVTNTDRLIQLGQAAVQPPGQARRDLWIIQQLGARLGLPVALGADDGVAAVYQEMRQAIGAPLAGVPWDRLVRDGAVQTPCAAPDQPGQAVVFEQCFPTPSGRARLVVPADPLGHLVASAHGVAPHGDAHGPDHDHPDADFPLVLTTGRLLEHWHTGSMTRRAGVLNALEPCACASVHPDTLTALGAAPGDTAELATRRGAVMVVLRADPGVPVDAVFMPFAYREAAANLLTPAALDPVAKIPEFKYAAARLRRCAPTDAA